MSDWLFDHYGAGAYPPGWDNGTGSFPPGWEHSHASQLGSDLLLNEDGHLVAVADAKGAHGTHGGGTGGTGGTGTGGTGGTGSSTLVGSSTGLQINLLWDASVLSAPNVVDIENSVISAAQIFTSNFATHAVINIGVGLGEVNGASMNGALGTSQTFGSGVSYATLTNALGAADANLVSSGLMAAGAVTAVSALAAKTFFLASAESKALGLSSATSTAIDGYIGLASGGALAFTSAIGGQYDAVGVAAHEISEVMGRISLEGSQGYFTALDLFRYSAPNHPETTSTTGYFSTDLGVTALNYFNNPAGGGDAGDWASSAANATDAFDAYDNGGVTSTLSKTDLVEVAALGYKPAGALGPVTA